MTEPHVVKPRIRSFVLRAGRVGPGQARALAELGPQFLLPYQPQPLDLENLYGRAAPKILEIGFGMGEGMADIAQAHPENDYLGVEVHTPGVGALLKQLGERGLSNVRIIQHDAVEVLSHMLAPASLDGAHVFFPVLVFAEGIYTVTDPPLKFLRRLIPPLSLGTIRLDLAFVVLMLAVSLTAGLLQRMSV